MMMDEGTSGKLSMTQMDPCQVTAGRLSEPVELRLGVGEPPQYIISAIQHSLKWFILFMNP